MRKAAAIIALVILAVAGCDDGQQREEARPTKITNPPHNQLLALPGELQRLGVMRALRDNGRRCQRVEATRYQEDYRQMAMWVALCADGRYWSLFIAPNGDTQVRECENMEQLGLPQCRPVTGPGAPPPVTKG